MMAVHELGHVAGALLTGGSIERVILHPLTISRTVVSPNPKPAIVVWLGPVIGCVLPLAMVAVIRKRPNVWYNNIWYKVGLFFVGFCLIANGAYIAVGSFDRVGECGEMLRTGTPLWAMLAFGAVTIPLGLYQWHALGSLNQFINDPSVVTRRIAYVVFGGLIVAVVAGFALSPR